MSEPDYYEMDEQGIAEAQGWTQETLLGLTIDWIDSEADKAAYHAYLVRRAVEENEAADSMAMQEVIDAASKVRAPSYDPEWGD